MSMFDTNMKQYYGDPVSGTGVAQHSQHLPGGGGEQQTQAGQNIGSSV